MGALTPLRLAAARREGRSVPDTSVILIWLPGGPPHMETYDMKPDAPAEYRGAFKPIKTVVPGMDVCEYLPLHARIGSKFSLIRSIAHTFSDHGGGHKKFLTGRDPISPVGFVNGYPAVGSMVARMRQDINCGIPNYIAGTDPGRDGIDVFSFGSAYLGPSTHPFSVTGDPSLPTFSVKNLGLGADQRARLRERTELLRGLDVALPGLEKGTTEGLDGLKKRAFHLLTSD
jgi:hypothetical protein